MNSKVTIMIPTYNQSQYIEQAVDSALAQDYPNVEIIISDDSTDDLTEEIVKEKYKKYLENRKIKYFHNKPSLGRVKNYRTTLYERATGDYVLNLDGDDWLIDNNYISEAVKILDGNKDVVCVTAKVKIFDENKNKIIERDINKKLIDGKMEGCEYLKRMAIDDDFSFSHMSTLYRRKNAIQISFYDKDIIFSDGESMFRLICGKKIFYLNRFIGVWRIHLNNESHKYQNISYDEMFFLENSLINFCKQNNKCEELSKFIKILKIKKLYERIKKNFLKESICLFNYNKNLFYMTMLFSIKRFPNILKKLIK